MVTRTRLIVVIRSLPVLLFFKLISAEVDSHKYFFFYGVDPMQIFTRCLIFGAAFCPRIEHMTGGLYSRVHDVSVQMTSVFIDTALTTLILRRRSSLQIARISLCPLNTLCDQFPPETVLLSINFAF